MGISDLLDVLLSNHAVLANEVTTQNGSHDRTVMVVDDDGDFRLLLCARLTRMGMKCFEAENGEAARLQLKDNPVDLLITDNQMPKMDGLELIKWLQQTQRHLPPIIFVSGDLTVRAKVQQAGVFAFLEKPCSLSQLSLVVEEVFNNN